MNVEHAEVANEQKLLATLVAQFAITGYQVHALASGGFLVFRYGCVRHCSHIDSLEAFANEVEANRWPSMVAKD
jgi:hypothetical protein